MKQSMSAKKENIDNVMELIDKSVTILQNARCNYPQYGAEAIIACVLGVSIDELQGLKTKTLSTSQAKLIADQIQRRSQRVPLEYIIGQCQFRGLILDVDERVFVPQEQSGPLVELALALPIGARVHDVGTGSGAIALAIKNERSDLIVSGSDVSEKAIEVARANSAKLGLSVNFTVESGLPDGNYDLVIANLPYQDEHSKTMSLRPELTQYMPHVAIFAGDTDGLGVIREFVQSVRCETTVAIEHAVPQTALVRSMFREAEVLNEATNSRSFTVGRLL